MIIERDRLLDKLLGEIVLKNPAEIFDRIERISYNRGKR